MYGDKEDLYTDYAFEGSEVGMMMLPMTLRLLYTSTIGKDEIDYVDD